VSPAGPNTLQRQPVTPLRRRFERARSFEPAAQIQELVYQLTNPGELSEEVLDAYELMLSGVETGAETGVETGAEAEAKPEAPQGAGAPNSEPGESAITLAEGFFWEARELMVLGDHCSFTCLATNVHPLCPTATTNDGLSTGLDYVGLTCDSSSALVLGAVQAPGDATAYPLLLRLLACLCEIARPETLEALNQSHLKGVAQPTSLFDLNLVLWDRSDVSETNPIGELTRDLAEGVKRDLQSSDRFPKILRDIVCLRMNPDRFDGRMRFDWRI
jgi:hypothetical protein